MLLLAGSAILPLAALACGDDDDGDADTQPTSGAQTAAPTETSAPASSPTAAAAEPEVQVVDNAFTPANLTVDAGTEVTWTWSGSFPHSVVGTFAGEDVQSETLTGSGTFTFTFDEAGEFDYVCGVHGADMSGKVIVE